MTTETWVVFGLVVLSVAGATWPTLVNYFQSLGSSMPSRNPDAFQKRMDLVNELLKECKGCEAETKAVVQAGDVIAKHWRENHKGGSHE